MLLEPVASFAIHWTLALPAQLSGLCLWYACLCLPVYVSMQAQLNRAISLLGAGRGAEAQRELDMAYRRTNRVELYDTVKQLKRLYKENKKMSKVLESLATEDDEVEGGEHKVEKNSYTVVEVDRFENKDPDVTPPGLLALALDVRAFQVRHVAHHIV